MGFMTRRCSVDQLQALEREVILLRSLIAGMENRLDDLAAVNRRLEKLQELHCVNDDKLHMLAKHLGLKFVAGTRIEEVKED